MIHIKSQLRTIVTKLLVFGLRVKISIIVIVCGGSFVGIKDLAVMIRLFKLLKMKYFFNIKMFKAYQQVKSNNFNRFQIKDTVLSELIQCWEKAEVKTSAKSDINPPFVRRRGSESLNNPGSVIPVLSVSEAQRPVCVRPWARLPITDHNPSTNHTNDTFLGLGPWGLIRTGALRRRLHPDKKGIDVSVLCIFCI